MKVLFVYPNVVKHPKDISIGIGYLAAVLGENGHETDLVDTTFGATDEKIVSKVKSSQAGLIAISSTTANFGYAQEVAALIKTISDTPIIIGGVHPTVAPEETIAKDCFDMICFGEGEEALLELVESMEKGEHRTDIANIWFKKDGQVISNRPRCLRTDLDVFPFPKVELYDYDKLLKNHNWVASFLGSRGCPYKCTYCINHTNQKLYKDAGPYVRFREIDKIIEEIKTIMSKYRVDAINFYDETFTLNKKRVKEFCSEYKRHIGIPFYVNARLDTISDEMCRDLAGGGCVRVGVGLESGSPEIRKKILKKNISNEQIIEGARHVKNHGIKLYTYNMIGIPGETMADIEKTIELNREVLPDFLNVSIFTAFKGTELYDLCKEQGMLDEDKPLLGFLTSTNVKHPNFTLQELRHIQQIFGFKVFWPNNKRKALVELIDKRLINIPLYSRTRSMLISTFMRPGKA